MKDGHIGPSFRGGASLKCLAGYRKPFVGEFHCGITEVGH